MESFIKGLAFLAPLLILGHSVLLGLRAERRRKGNGCRQLLGHLSEIEKRALPQDLIVCALPEKRRALIFADFGFGPELHWIVVVNEGSATSRKDAIINLLSDQIAQSYATSSFDAYAVSISKFSASDDRLFVEAFLEEERLAFTLHAPHFFDTYSWSKRKKIRRNDTDFRNTKTSLKALFEGEDSCFKSKQPILTYTPKHRGRT